MLQRQTLIRLALVVVGFIAPRPAEATPGQTYHRAVAYLRAHAATALSQGEAQAILLGEAVAADPLVVGPRSTTEISSLELVSADARGRRAQTLAALDLDVSGDEAALLALLRLARPSPLSLNGADRTNPELPKFGEDETRVPSVLDDALALQGLAAGFAGAMVDPAIEDAIYYLLEFQIAGGAHDGAWALFDRGSSGAGADVGDVGVTAQAVLGLEPYRNTTLSTPTDLPLGTVENALTDAITYLQAVMPSGAVEHALRLLALLAVGASTQADLDNLVDLAPDGNFGSVFATALAARAIRAASSEYPFDSDGDGVADVTDPDDDDDGFPDATDAFPLDNAWHTDTDNDGLADEDPNETDVDGDGVADGVEPGFANDAQESMDSDSDGTGNVADDQDDHDGLTDVEELLIGLDPRDEDTDNDSFRDKAEVNAGKDGRDPTDYPLPDGDIYPLGSPDGITDLRDVLFAFRIVRGDLTGEGQPFFMRHADVAPLGAGGSPAPDGQFGPGDALVILRRVTGEIAVW